MFLLHGSIGLSIKICCLLLGSPFWSNGIALSLLPQDLISFVSTAVHTISKTPWIYNIWLIRLFIYFIYIANAVLFPGLPSENPHPLLLPLLTALSNYQMLGKGESVFFKSVTTGWFSPVLGVEPLRGASTLHPNQHSSHLSCSSRSQGFWHIQESKSTGSQEGEAPVRERETR